MDESKDKVPYEKREKLYMNPERFYEKGGKVKK
jgi:hypothetical protein